MDSNFVACPYNPQHRIQRLRIQYHLVKCQGKSPNLAICPYNATHRFPRAEMPYHVSNCASKVHVMPETHAPRVLASVSQPTPIVQRDYMPESDPNYEMWDN